MRWPWNISDAEFVRRVDRFQSRWQCPCAIVMVIFSAFFVAIAYYLIRLIESGVFPLLPDEATRSAFQTGVVLGYFVGKTVFAATLDFFYGLYWLFARRKDQLLITYHRRLCELGELNEPT